MRTTCTMRVHDLGSVDISAVTASGRAVFMFDCSFTMRATVSPRV